MPRVKRLTPNFETMYATATQMAEILGMSKTNLDKLVSKKVLTREENESKLPFHVQNTIHAYVERLREQAAGRASSGEYELNAERARETFHKANLAELKEAKAVGAVIDRNDILSAWARIISTSKSKLLGLGSRLKIRIPSLTDDQIEMIDDEVTTLLNQLAESGEVSVERVLKDASE